MSPTNISSDRVHDFNLATLALDRELEAESMIDLLLMPEELRQNSIVAAQWHTAGDRQVCFPKNTKIKTATGMRNIQELKKGDLVQSHLGWKKIKETMKRRYSGKMVRIETSDGRYLIATGNHPIFEIKRGWIEIGKLRRVDRLKTCEDKIVEILRIQNISFFKSYNLISKLSKILVFLGILQKIMPITSINFKTNTRVWKEKINTISFDLKFLNKVNLQLRQTVFDLFFKRTFSRIFAITGKGTKLFVIFLIGANSKLFSAIRTSDIYRWSSAFFRAVMIYSMVTIKDFAASFTGNSCYSREFAFLTTDLVSGYIRPMNRELFFANRANFNYSLIAKKNAIALQRTKSYTSYLDFPRSCIKRFLADFTGKIFAFPSMLMIAFSRAIRMIVARSSKRKMFSAVPTDKNRSCFYMGFVIALQRAKFLVRTTLRLKILFAKLALHIYLLLQYFSRFINICQAFDVYNLEVEDAHTYYANGILVHNCPLCATLDGNIFPVDSGEWGRIFPPIHLQCFLSSRILIDTLNGWKKIGDIAVGDQVLTHRGRFRRVSKLFRSCNYRGKVVTVIMDGSYEKFTVTPEHPFLTEDGWKKSLELRNSDKILSLSTKSKPDNYEFVPWKIKSVKSHLLSRRKKLFNFAVEEDESYIAMGLVSHNCRCMLSYITSQERGVEARIREYRPIDPELLKKWSSKIYTKAEIAEIAKHHKEFIPEEELEI